MLEIYTLQFRRRKKSWQRYMEFPIPPHPPGGVYQVCYQVGKRVKDYQGCVHFKLFQVSLRQNLFQVGVV